MSRISIIAAVDSRMAIGFQNKLLFWLPNDLKRFKALTTGNTIIMGRKTFESLPGAEVFTSLEAALESCQAEEKVYIIGGASVYRQAISLADELCLTEVNDTAPEADAFFPAVDTTIWHEKSREVHPADEKHLCSYAFVDYVRGID